MAPEHRDLIVVGASAGGVPALEQLVGSLGSDLPAAILVVLHFPAVSRSFLPDILKRAGRLPARHVEDGEPIEKGTIYVAPPGLHLIVSDSRLQLVHGPQQNGRRPSIDTLFRSAAREFGRRTIGIVLSGLLDDGTIGLAAIKRRGGATLAQDPADARYPDMPRSAILNATVDHVLPISRMGSCLLELLAAELPPDGEPSERYRKPTAAVLETAEVLRAILVHRSAEDVPAPPVEVDAAAEEEDKRGLRPVALEPDEGT